jgi:hypothetical protein
MKRFTAMAARALASGATMWAALLWSEGAAYAEAGSLERRPDAACSGYAEQKLGADQAVRFCDDDVGGGGFQPLGATLRRPPGAIRAGLIRPRLQFVTEMLKSVENM